MKSLEETTISCRVISAIPSKKVVPVKEICVDQWGARRQEIVRTIEIYVDQWEALRLILKNIQLMNRHVIRALLNI